jgi:hypothetical protein
MATPSAAAMAAVLAMTGHADLLNATNGVCREDLRGSRFIPALGNQG